MLSIEYKYLLYVVEKSADSFSESATGKLRLRNRDIAHVALAVL